MTNLIKRLLRKIRISEIMKYVSKNLTHDVFLSRLNEVIIFYNNKIYAIWYEDGMLMLSRAGPYTGSAFDFGKIEFLISQIISDPYKMYGIKTREYFESLMPRIKSKKDKKDERINK